MLEMRCELKIHTIMRLPEVGILHSLRKSGKNPDRQKTRMTNPDTTTQINLIMMKNKRHPKGLLLKRQSLNKFSPTFNLFSMLAKISNHTCSHPDIHYTKVLLLPTDFQLLLL